MKSDAYLLNTARGGIVDEDALYDALGPKWATTIYGDTAQYRVLLELDPKYQGHVDSLEIVTMVLFLEKQFGIRMGPADVSAANFSRNVS